MNFLNEVTMRYPGAISFGAGRPAEDLFTVEQDITLIDDFVDHLASKTGCGRMSAYNALGQYGRTNGLIHDLIARFLANDEGIHIPPESLVITDGCQEAMTILLMGLFNRECDVLLVQDPTYIGITGMAAILGIRVAAVPTQDGGPDEEALERTCDQLRSSGLRPRALYVIPNFNNPLGVSLPLQKRHRLLQLAAQLELLILEDNPYGVFAYDAPPIPTLKCLDRNRTVIYMSTFSKTMFPGVRVGFIAADQMIAEADGKLLGGLLSKIKSLTTVNTSPLLQAIVGGALIRHECSFRSMMEHKSDFYRRRRDVLLQSLDLQFGPLRDSGLSVDWNRPGGGFFLVMSLPFAMSEERVIELAEAYGVICCPMTFFSLIGDRTAQIRLSFSYVTETQIKEGVRRLRDYITNAMARDAGCRVAAG